MVCRRGRGPKKKTTQTRAPAPRNHESAPESLRVCSESSHICLRLLNCYSHPGSNERSITNEFFKQVLGFESSQAENVKPLNLLESELVGNHPFTIFRRKKHTRQGKQGRKGEKR